MGDEEGDCLILENSPLHSYLKSIGYNEEVEIVTRKEPITAVKSNGCAAQPDVAHEKGPWLIDQFVFPNLTEFVSLDVGGVIASCHRSMLPVHQDHLQKLSTTDKQDATLKSRHYLLGRHLQFNFINISGTICLFLSLALISFILPATLISVLLACIFYQWRSKSAQIKSLDQYVRKMSSFKKICKTVLSHLRDAQVARSNYLSGVTWPKLDSLEKDHTSLVLLPVREQLCSALCAVSAQHRAVVLRGLDNFSLNQDVDNRARYLSCQEDDDDVDVGVPTSLVLRKHLKVVEHLTSEVLWKLCAGCCEGVQSVTQSALHLQFYLESLSDINATVEAQQSSLSHVFGSFTNSTAVTPASLGPRAPADPQTKAQTDLALQLQFIHSSLHVATLRSLEVHKTITSAAELHQGHFDEVYGILELLKSSVELSSDGIEKCMERCREVNNTEGLQLSRSVEETELSPCDELPTLVPYKQERNEVYSGVNTGEEEEERGYCSDEEYELWLKSHKKESKFLMKELRHVIETEPTSLYDEDYLEFKQSGLLNPTKSEMKERRELEGVGEEVEEEEVIERGPALNLSMFCQPMKGSWMEECTIQGEGEASSESEEDEGQETIPTMDSSNTKDSPPKFSRRDMASSESEDEDLIQVSEGVVTALNDNNNSDTRDSPHVWRDTVSSDIRDPSYDYVKLASLRTESGLDPRATDCTLPHVCSRETMSSDIGDTIPRFCKRDMVSSSSDDESCSTPTFQNIEGSSSRL